MSRLPGVEQYECSPDIVRRYIDGCLDIQRTVQERMQAAKLPVKELDLHRKTFTKTHFLYTPGIDWALRLEHDFTPVSRREWLRSFDMTREIRGLDRLTDDQLDLLEQHYGEEVADAVANTAA